MSYRKQSVSKGARRAHHRREKARRRKLREEGGQIEPFGFVVTRGIDRAGMRRLSVSKGQRDGSPLLAIATEARRAETPKIGSVHEGAGPQDIAQPPSGDS
jgi:DNA-binding IclR family transcriptional regulator